MLRKISLTLFALLLLILVISAGWYGWQLLRDPLDFLDPPMSALQVVQDSVFSDRLIPEPRTYHKLVFSDNDHETVQCIMSLPESLSGDKLPVLIILGGLEVGIQNLKHIPDPGNNAIIIYQYPYHPRYWYYGSAVREIPVIRNSVLRVPAQVLALYRWVGRQNWADSSRINLAGYSFGALFVPAILHLTQHHNGHFPHAVISYGGADLYHLLAHNMTNLNQPWRGLVSHLAITAIRGIEPALHAPHIRSDVLLINGTMDSQIPESCWRLLHRLIPRPKQIIMLEEGHMDPRKTELTIKLVQITREWLLGRGAINE